MKQWLFVVSLVTLLVWTGFLSGCSSDGDGHVHLDEAEKYGY